MNHVLGPPTSVLRHRLESSELPSKWLSFAQLGAQKIESERLVTSASLLVTSALLVVTRSY